MKDEGEGEIVLVEGKKKVRSIVGIKEEGVI